MWRALAFVALLAAAGAEAARPVVVVSDQPIFRAAAESAASNLPGAETVLAADVRKGALDDASAVVAVGPLAARAVVRASPSGTAPIVTCLSPPVRGLPSQTVVVPLFPTTREVAAAIRAILPRASRLGVFRSSSHPFVRADAEAAGLSVVEPSAAVALTSAIDGVLSTSDVVWVTDPSVFAKDAVALDYLLKSAVARNVPVIGANRAMVESGALFALVPDPVRVGARAATIASGAGIASGESDAVSQVLVGARASKRYRVRVPAALLSRVVVVD